jgi:ribosomal protein L15E
MDRTMSGTHREHEATAARASRQRRLERGESCATYVLDQWRKGRRIARVAKLSPADRKRLLGS